MFSHDYIGLGVKNINKGDKDRVLMMFTGLLDDFNAEIYDGDILIKGSDTYLVSFGETTYYTDYWGLKHSFIGWRIQFIDGDYNPINQEGGSYGIIAKDCIVAGNIYQNPELFKLKQ